MPATNFPNGIRGPLLDANEAAEAAITSLTDSSGGTANDTVEALPATQSTPSGMTAAERTAISNNFADISAKLNAILTALRDTQVISS